MGPHTDDPLFAGGAHGKTRDELAAEARLKVARATFPAWDIHETFGGFLAVPKGAAVVQAIAVEDLAAKLREREAGAR